MWRIDFLHTFSPTFVYDGFTFEVTDFNFKGMSKLFRSQVW
jgi:hypothetical protein